MNAAEAMNDTLFKNLENMSTEQIQEAGDAVRTYTRFKMYSLHHIPARYLIMEEEQKHLVALCYELNTTGRILLDRDAKPACISGRRPGLWAAFPDLHGPWKEEPCAS
jgi:hypothetical protein